MGSTNRDKKAKEALLNLRNCATGSARKLGRALGVERSTAQYRLQRLEETGLVTGYIPIITPTFFGTSYLIKVKIDPALFQIKSDVQKVITKHKDYLLEGINHAPIGLFVFEEKGFWQVHCLTMTKNIERFIEELCQRRKIAVENVEYVVLKEANGIPLYSKFSLRDEKQ